MGAFQHRELNAAVESHANARLDLWAQQLTASSLPCSCQGPCARALDGREADEHFLSWCGTTRGCGNFPPHTQHTDKVCRPTTASATQAMKRFHCLGGTRLLMCDCSAWHATVCRGGMHNACCRFCVAMQLPSTRRGQWQCRLCPAPMGDTRHQHMTHSQATLAA